MFVELLNFTDHSDRKGCIHTSGWVKCAGCAVRLASRLMDDPLEVIGDWVDALTAQYGQDGLPPWDRYEAAIALIEQAQRLLMPERRLRIVTE